MNKPMNFREENPKRKAFKRFSQMGVAGLAVLSMSTFTNVSAQEETPKVEIDSLMKQTPPLLDSLNADPVTGEEIRWLLQGYYNAYGAYTNYTNCYYNNYSDYSNNYNYTNSYNNNYGNNYSDNYSNYSNYSNSYNNAINK